jgi:hypothetical protein
MKRWEIIFALIALLFLALGYRWIRQGELPKQETWIDAGGCRTPVTILEPPPDVTPAGSVILLHGLSPLTCRATATTRTRSLSRAPKNARRRRSSRSCAAELSIRKTR